MDDEQDLKSMGGLRRYMQLTVCHLRLRMAGDRRGLPAVGLLGQGRRPLQRLRALPCAVGDRSRHGAADRLLHDEARTLAFYGRLPLAAGASRAGTGCALPRRTRHARSRTSRRWIMTVPLVVLAALSFSGGLLDLPVALGESARSWLDPVFGSAPAPSIQSAGTSGPLRSSTPSSPSSGFAVAWRLWRVDRRAPGARAGGAAAGLLHRRRLRLPHRPARACLRPLLRHGVRPPGHRRGGRRRRHACARAAGGGLRRVQTGFVRQYALGIVLRCGGPARPG